MLKRLLGLLGWLGVALVFASVAIRNLRPEWGWWYGLAIGGLVCVLLYVLSQWREIARDFSGRQARYGTLAARERAHRPGHPGGHQLPGRAAQQAVGPDGGEPVLAVGPDEEGAAGPDQAGEGHGLCADRRLRALPDRLEEYQYVTKQLEVEYIDPEKRPSLAEKLKENALGTIVLSTTDANSG